MPLTPAETNDLRTVARMMIPPGDVYDVPGADDPVIFADIIASLGRDTEVVRQALARLAALAGGTLADAGEATVASFQAEGGPLPATLSRVIVQCYYRDDRVVRSLGLEPGPPFPRGRTLEQGDWSLLDPVRARPKLWRDVPPRTPKETPR